MSRFNSDEYVTTDNKYTDKVGVNCYILLCFFENEIEYVNNQKCRRLEKQNQ